MDKVYNNRHLLVATTQLISSRENKNRLVAVISGWEWTTSLELLASQFETIKAGKPLSIYPVAITDGPCDYHTVLTWPAVLTDDIASVVPETHQYIFSLKATDRTSAKSVKVAKKHNTSDWNENETDSESNASENSSDSEHSQDSELQFEAFQESLGNLAEEMERRGCHAGSSTHELSAAEIHGCLYNDSFADLDDANDLDKRQAESEEQIVDAMEKQRIQQASNLDLFTPGVEESVHVLESEGMFQEAATFETALNSEKVMGNSNFDDDPTTNHETEAGDDAAQLSSASGGALPLHIIFII